MQLDSAVSAFRDPKRWRAVAIGCWVLVFAGLVIRLIVAHGLHSVYPIFSDAARCWQRGEDMYFPHHYVAGLDPYRYSPAVAQFFSPLAHLSDRFGSILWLTLSAAAIVTGLVWWLHSALPREFGPCQIAAASLIVLTFAAGNLHNGQANTIVTALLLLAACGVCTERWTLVSCCIAAATLFKVYPLAFGMLLVVAFSRQLLARLSVAVLIGLALPFLFHPSDFVVRQYQEWYEVIRMDDRRHSDLPVCYRDLWLLVRVFQLPISSTAFTVVQGLGAAATAAICLWAKRVGLNVRQMTMLCLTLFSFWLMLFGPATESSTYLILAPVMAWIVLDAWNLPRFRYELPVIGISLAFFCAAHMSVWFPEQVRRGSIIFQPTGALVLSLVALCRAYCEISGCRSDSRHLVEAPERLAA